MNVDHDMFNIFWEIEAIHGAQAKIPHLVPPLNYKELADTLKKTSLARDTECRPHDFELKSVARYGGVNLLPENGCSQIF